MLPFRKNQDEVGASAGEEDEGEFNFLDAIADDFMEAIHKRDKSLLRDALEAFCEYVQEEDEKQDKLLMHKED